MDLRWSQRLRSGSNGSGRPAPGAHGHFPYGGHACLFEELSEQSIGFIRVVRNEEPGPLEIMRISLEEVHELVKLDQFAGLGRGLWRWSCMGVTGEL